MLDRKQLYIEVQEMINIAPHNSTQLAKQGE
jgi:hypothetical protein